MFMIDVYVWYDMDSDTAVTDMPLLWADNLINRQGPWLL